MTVSELVTDAKIEKLDEWPMRTAASFNPFITSGSRGWAKYYADHGDLFIRITNLKRHKIKPDLSDRQHVALPTSEKEGLRTGLRQGDILISITADIGIIGYVDESVPTPAYINQHVACLRLPADQVSPKFVAYYLASAEPQRRFIEMTDVGAKTGVNLTTVGRLTFPCPSLDEQEAIAEALSDADTLIDGLERLIAKKRLIKHGAMQDLVTGKRRLPGYSADWTNAKVGDFLSFKNGLNKPKAFFGHGTPIVNYLDVFRGGAINEGSIDGLVEVTAAEQSAYGIKNGDVLFTRTSETPEEIGLAAVADGVLDGTVFSGFVLRGRPKSQALTIGFSKYCFHSEAVRRQIISRATYTTRALTNGRQLSEVDILVPRDVDEQNAIAEVLNDMEAEIHGLETRLEKARQLKEGMMQNLLTGRIRLI
ncbi:UNVERIFIED_ORG: type I restriction enzyme S subunit [Rhizobium esperanzae]